jgi:hypothetical protein
MIGSIAGFDRLLFRGSLLSICHRDGLDKFLGSQGVLYKDWQPFVQPISTQIKAQAEGIAQEAGRPLLYLASAQTSKEEVAKELVKRDRIQEGLVCVLSCVEPCQTFGIPPTARVNNSSWCRKNANACISTSTTSGREFGLMRIRLQTRLPLTIQVCLSGRAWLARRMEQVGIAYEQKDNCFTSAQQKANFAASLHGHAGTGARGNGRRGPSPEMGKAKADNEVTAQRRRPVCRSREDGREERDKRSKWGTSRLQSQA